MIITQNASMYLFESLKKEGDSDLVVYISVIYPKTKHSHVNITFCSKSDLNKRDLMISQDDTSMIYVDFTSIALLKDSTIDLRNNNLIINAPNIYEKHSNVSLKDGIKSLFENEINVMLSQHGGFVEVLDLIDDKDIVVKFHGGCQGCTMVDYTLGNYIEKTVKKHFPSIERISDVTSHAVKDKAYY